MRLPVKRPHCPTALLPRYLPAVTPRIILTGAAFLLLPVACGGGPELASGSLPSSSRSVPNVTALRIPRDGGLARLYRIPSLDSAAWKAADALPPIATPVGADAEQGLVFVLDRKNNVVALDLDTRRVRTYLENVRYATVGPDGAVYAVDTGSTVTQLVRRTPVRFRSKLQGKPTELYGTIDGALLARLGGNRPALEFLGSDQAPTSTSLPEGQVAATFLGDLIAVAADTAVVLYTPQNKSKPRSIPVEGDARAVLFSPSGHRLYIARAAAPLLVLDRFANTRLREIELPGPARALRGDIYGNWLLVQPQAGDSVWVIDMGSGKYLGATAARWTDDLPAVAPAHTLLVRRGSDLVALDLAASGFPELGRVKGGAADFWLPLAWHPAQENELPLEADSAALAASDTGPARPTVYLQVSSSQNPTWASELSDKLRAAGLPAAVLSPRRSGELFRVVLGPYATREQAEETGRKLGMPSFIVTAQDQSSQ
ncbi:MAG TPA: SPOR domain-containing protein [Gemmatimonadales bacterium]|nr:SPOR domain-containing protein [Gemmatimonadales bacterium]